MPLDGLFTHALVHELNATITGGRITKIHQPYPNEIILVVRQGGNNYPVLLSAHPSFARVQITKIPYENPQTAPSFAMLLRRNLEGARIERIEQVDNDRIVNFYVQTHDELGDRQTLFLALEMMGRHSNLFLVREKDQRILELIKHVPADQNRIRSLIPGATYTLPPNQHKINPFKDDGQAIARMILDQPHEDWAFNIMETYQGFSRESANSLALTLTHADDSMAAFQQWLANFDQLTPTLFTNDQGKLSFAPFDWASPLQDRQHYPSLGDLLDAYYIGKAEHERVNQQAGSLIRLVKNELKKNQSKLKKLEQTLTESQNASQFKVMGDLLITYPHLVQKGMQSVKIENYYDENRQLTIPLDPRLDGLKNAEKYFRKYRKLRTAKDYVNQQIKLTQAELNYFEQISAQLAVASPKDVADFRVELMAEGYLKSKKKSKQKPKVSQPDQFHSSDGTLIEVGKNNLQNERLSLKKANRSFIWLHVQNIPGSHVIVHSDHPSEQTLLEAAQLAAYYSKAQESANVAVDYLPAGKLRKPNGSKPGYVIFEGQQTLYVTPSATLVQQLKLTK